MKHLFALVMMQLKDKLNFSFTASKQKLISFIVFTALKFIAVTAVAYLFFMLTSMLNIFSVGGGVPKNIMVLVHAIILIMSLFSCTVGLMKTLYFADDNKVLITLPVDGNVIFISRLIVYYVFELKRSLFLTIPIFLAFGIFQGVGAAFYPWLIISFLFISAIPVVVGAILSIPAMYIYRVLQKLQVLKFIIYAGLIVAATYGVVALIALIPTDIDMVQMLGPIQQKSAEIFRWCTKWVFPSNRITDIVIGFEKVTPTGYTYTIFRASVFIYFGIMVLGLAVLLAITFLITRPMFIKMVSSSFEFKKKILKISKPNRRLNRALSLIKTEVASFIRSGLLSSFISVYLVVPVLIFLINKIFGAINTRTSGTHMVYAFNLLLIVLPMLASNALISTIYSRDGRAIYVKKTMPISPVLSLSTKLIPVLLLSNVSLIVSICIFGNMVGFSALNIALLCISGVALNCGHILWSALLDLMNPQNEHYATSGEMQDNPNERSSTVIAFIVSAVYAFFSFVLFSDIVKNAVSVACIKLALIGIAFLIATGYMFVNKINIYYNEK